MTKQSKLEQDIEQIKDRNKRVEADKAWEVSNARKVLISVLTYTVIVIFFFVANLPNPFVNALVPTLGFILSTLTINFIKKVWIKRFMK